MARDLIPAARTSDGELACPFLALLLFCLGLLLGALLQRRRTKAGGGGWRRCRRRVAGGRRADVGLECEISAKRRGPGVIWGRGGVSELLSAHVDVGARPIPVVGVRSSG